MQWKGTIIGGQTYTNPVINLDVLPTVLTAAGGQVDPEWKLDGVDLLPYLTGVNSARPHETLYWRFSPQWAVRKGDLKLVQSNGGSGKPELYDLSQDASESKDLAGQMPDKVKELQALYDTWSAQQLEATSPKEKPAKAAADPQKKKKKKHAAAGN
jgi:arylsulfatase A-like enzyme